MAVDKTNYLVYFILRPPEIAAGFGEKMSKVIVFLFIVMLSTAPLLPGEELPDWFTPLRDAIYSQNQSSMEIAVLYSIARERANEELYGVKLAVMLSRCEYMMGRSYVDEENKKEAAACFEKGLRYAQESLDLRATPEGWQMMADNISYLCSVKSMAFIMANGLKVDRYSKNALKLDSGNTTAQFLVAARWVYAPTPLHNYRRGLAMMEAIARDYDHRLQKDDRFNVYLAIGDAHNQQKRKEEAKIWYLKAKEIYPENKRVNGMLSGFREQAIDWSKVN